MEKKSAVAVPEGTYQLTIIFVLVFEAFFFHVVAHIGLPLRSTALLVFGSFRAVKQNVIV